MGSRRALSAALAAVVLAATLISFALLTSSGSGPMGTAPVISAPVARTAGTWVGSWAAAPSSSSRLRCVDCTIRNVVHSSAGGSALRVRLANPFATLPLVVGHTTVALPADAGSAAATPTTVRTARFGDRRQVVVPAGGSVWSDPVHLTLPADHDLLVSLYLPGLPEGVACHPLARQVSYLASGPDASARPDASRFTGRTSHWYVLSGVDVRATGYQGAVVMFGDSITDGAGSTPGTDRRWPDLLADRLLERSAGARMAVLNAGISGNRLLPVVGRRQHGPPALSRLDRDVLDQTGVRTVVLLEGINDIQELPHQFDANRIAAAQREIVARLHARGLRVVGATLTPFGGSAAYRPTLERVRERVNRWIRSSAPFDAVLDFDAAVRDPAHPRRLAARYDCGDHLHPGDAGYAAMDAAIPLDLL